jgi:hypothetical protein
MLAAYRAHAEEDVAAGRRTQAQADADIAAFEDRLDEIVNRTFTGRPGSDEAPATSTG